MWLSSKGRGAGGYLRWRWLGLLFSVGAFWGAEVAASVLKLRMLGRFREQGREVLGMSGGLGLLLMREVGLCLVLARGVLMSTSRLCEVRHTRLSTDGGAQAEMQAGAARGGC